MFYEVPHLFHVPRSELTPRQHRMRSYELSDQNTVDIGRPRGGGGIPWKGTSYITSGLKKFCEWAIGPLRFLKAGTQFVLMRQDTIDSCLSIDKFVLSFERTLTDFFLSVKQSDEGSTQLVLSA